MKAYSIDLRQKIIEAYKNKEGSQRQLAQRFKVSLSFIQTLLKRYRESAEIAPRSRGKGFAPRLAGHIQTVEKLVAQKNDATLEELQEAIARETGIKLSISNICRFLQKRKLTRKKRCDPAPSQGARERAPRKNAEVKSSSNRKSTKSSI